MVNLPLSLTYFRLFISPFVMPVLGYLGCYYGGWYQVFSIIFFVLFALSDFFDGYLARRWHQESKLGSSLDPLADKIFVFSCLIPLILCHGLWWGWGFIIVARDAMVTLCRLSARSYNMTVPVSYLGKIKTVFQLVLMGVLFACPAYRHSLLIKLLIFFAIMSTVVSGIAYIMQYARMMIGKKG